MTRARWAALTLIMMTACWEKKLGEVENCGAGRTNVDGLCVSNHIADYVACVRSQGAKLDAERSDRLSAAVKTHGVEASAEADLRDRLEKQYSVSSRSELEIIQRCGSFANGRVEPPRADAATPPPDDGLNLLGWWKLDEGKGATVADASGRKHMGRLENGTSWSDGKFGGALRFVGGRNGVWIKNDRSLHSARDLTLSLWANVSVLPAEGGWYALLLKADSPDCAPPSVGCDHREYGLWVNQHGQLHATITPASMVGKGGWYCQTNGGAIKAGRWQHLSIVLSAERATEELYVDGKRAVWCGFDFAPLRTTSGPLVLGNVPTSTSGLVGLLDDVRIYGSALVEGNVVALSRGDEPEPTREAERAAGEVACDNGDAQACVDAAGVYRKAEAVSPDPRRAQRLLERACNAGHATACNEAGWLFAGNEGGAPDMVRAIVFFRQACDGGQAAGCLNGGNNTRGSDPSLAIKLYERGCGLHESGWAPNNCERLANMTERGEAVAADLERAVQLYQRACQRGLEPACTRLKELGR